MKWIVKVMFFFFFFLLAVDDALQKKVNCTACGKQVNQFQRNSVFVHPVLKVLICKVETLRWTFHIFSSYYYKFYHFHYFFFKYLRSFLFLQSCYKYYTSDDISRDSDGMDEQCRYTTLIKQ